MRLNQTRDVGAIIFCLTSPAFTSLANQPKFISAFFNNMKTNYGMSDYVWVRELTKAGYPHFHCVALWHRSKWFFQEKRITKISEYWSSLFGSDSKNSVRFGSYNPKTKKRSFYLTNSRHAWYLTKYLGKNIGDGHTDYLAEAGFPALSYRKSVRSFGMSENAAASSQPEIFESQYNTTDSRKVMTASGKYVTVMNTQREWVSEHGEVTDADMKAYSWKWTGHGETFIGFKRHSKKESKAPKT